ncbi:MAG: HAMP domain-containing protein, partial [Acidobacteriota bacterium]
MRISTKVTASSALFVLLLGGVLYYHLTSIGSQVVDHSQASALNFEAATLALELVRLVRDQGEMVRKFRVTKDADYGTRWAEIEAELTAGLEELKQLDLAPPSDRQAALVLQTWSEMRSHAAYRLVQAMATAAEHNRNAEDPAVDEASRDIPDSVEALANLEQPLVEEFDLATESAVLPPADSIEAESAADCDEEAAGDAIDAKLCRDFAKLGKQVEALLDATRASIGRQVEIASRSSFEVRTVSNNVALFALVLIVLISALTAHSIQAPLKRFTAGTRAVAEGNFFYHLDETTGDEFAELAVAFNSMAQRLGDLDRLKREFLAHVSHELKTPLVAMQETNTLLLEH